MTHDDALYPMEAEELDGQVVGPYVLGPATPIQVCDNAHCILPVTLN